MMTILHESAFLELGRCRDLPRASNLVCRSRTS